MPDFDFPADLLKLQRQYFAADARVEDICDALPRASAIVGGAIVDFTELHRAQHERLELAVRLQQDPWWQTIDKGDRVNAKIALRKAARNSSQAQT